MGIINLGDMSKVGAVPPDGAYAITILKVEAKASKNKEKPSTNLFIRYMIEGVVGEHLDPVASEQFVGQEFQTTVNVQETTLWRVQQVLEAVTMKEWRDDSMEFDPDDLIGGGAIIEGTEGEYNGQKQFNIQNWYSQNAYDPNAS